MSDKNKIFNFEFTGRAVRVVEHDGAPWFVAADVAGLLGYARPRDAISAHCKGAVKHRTLTNGGEQDLTVIPERDIYRLVMRSNMPEAEKFEDWVVGEVLPSIRKNGGYIAGQELETDPAVIIARALKVADNVIAAKERELLAAKAVIAEAAPKVEFYDAVAGSKTAIDIGSAAKILDMGIGRNRLFQFLRDHGVLQANNEPYQKHIDANHFRLVEQKFQKPNGDTIITKKTLVYQRGLDYIRKLLMRDGVAA